MQGDVFCERDKCTASGEDTIQVCCPICKAVAFCSERCMNELGGLMTHLSTMCPERKVHTPRSVLSDICSSIQNSRKALGRLTAKLDGGKRRTHVLLLDLIDMANACTILNSSVRLASSILSTLTVAYPIDHLHPLLQQQCTEMVVESRGLVFLIRTVRQGTVVRILNHL